MIRKLSLFSMLGLCSFAGAQLVSGPFRDVVRVHPSWTLTQARPTAWQPRVGGLDMLPDGRLLVMEHTAPAENQTGTPKANGRLFVVSNLGATNPDQIAYKKVAFVGVDTNISGQVGYALKEPVGLLYMNGNIYVSEKNQLNQYRLNTAADTATFVKTITTIPHDSRGTTNFQEYSMGPLYKDGFFYVASMGPVKSGGNSFILTSGTNTGIIDPTQVDQPMVGGVLKINEADGAKELLNGGLRACNGIGWGPENTIWVTDNEGSYKPTSPLIQIVPGRNYGYPSTTNAFFPNVPVEYAASVWMGPDAGNANSVSGLSESPTFPLLVQRGPYAGQMIMGDLSEGGLLRAFVEKVEGEWQGAAFSFTGGLEVGIEVIKEAPNGDLYVGGLGRGDQNNWGWNAKLFGLQKLSLKPGVTTFEMLAIRSRRTGMEIEFTKKVGPSAGVASNYTVEQGLMKPQSGYGVGSMLSLTGTTTNSPSPMTVVSALISPDSMKVFLQLDGLTASTPGTGAIGPGASGLGGAAFGVGRVIGIKPSAAVRSVDSDTVRNRAGWYTLNKISQSSPFASTAVRPRNSMSDAMARQIHLRSAAGQVRVNVALTGSHELTFKNLQGRTVLKRSGNGAQEYAFDHSQLQNGVYLLEVKSGGEVMRKTLAL